MTGPADGAVLIDRLRADGVVLTYDPDGRTLHAGGHDAPPVVIGKDATDTHSRQDRKRRTAQGKAKKESTCRGRRLSAGDDRACPRTAAHGVLTGSSANFVIGNSA